MRSAEICRLLGQQFLGCGLPAPAAGCVVQRSGASLEHVQLASWRYRGWWLAASCGPHHADKDRVQVVVVTSDVRPAAFARFRVYMLWSKHGRTAGSAVALPALSIRQDSSEYGSLFMCDAFALLVSHPLGHHDHIRFGMCQWSFGNFMRRAVCRSVCSVSSEH